MIKVKDGEGSLTWMGLGILLALILLGVYLYHFNVLPWTDGYKHQSQKAATGFAKYVAQTSAISRNNQNSPGGLLDSPGALPLYGAPGSAS